MILEESDVAPGNDIVLFIIRELQNTKISISLR